MTQINFALKPFDIQTAPNITIAGHIQRLNNQLQIQYQLQGDTDQIRWPPVVAQPTRRLALWEYTCLEFFIAQPRLKPYWEINLSPGGDWNIYRLSDYRQDLTEELAYDRLTITTQAFTLSTRLDLTPIIAPNAPINLSITAVIQTQKAEFSYWAIAHTGQEPDFHPRESFVLQL